MRALVSVLAFLALSACFDAELVLDFKDQDKVETTVTTTLARDLYDVASLGGDDPCAGGTGTLDETSFICVQTAAMTIDEAIARPNPFGTTNDFDPAAGLTVERVDANTARVTVDLDRLTGADNTPKEIRGMEGMAAAAFAGHSMIFRVRGYRILDTTGTLSDDGTQASLVVPLTGLIAGKPGVVSPFVTTVKLARTCKFLGMFCD